MTRRPPRSPLFPHTPLSRSPRDYAFYSFNYALSATTTLDLPLAPLFKQVAVHVQDSGGGAVRDRKSTRLHSSHGYTPYALSCSERNRINAVHARPSGHRTHV